MKTYCVRILRQGSRILTIDIEASSTEAAQKKARAMLRQEADGDSAELFSESFAQKWFLATSTKKWSEDLHALK